MRTIADATRAADALDAHGQAGRDCFIASSVAFPVLHEPTIVAGGEVVAHVSAAAELSDAQRTRLTEVLGRIYGRPASLQLHIDPELLGGLTIAVGDEVIDGSLASRLASAENQLPD